MEDLKEDQTLDTATVEAPAASQRGIAGHELFNPPSPRARAYRQHGEMMGPILRRKKVVSLPLGHGGKYTVSRRPLSLSRIERDCLGLNMMLLRVLLTIRRRLFYDTGYRRSSSSTL